MRRTVRLIVLSVFGVWGLSACDKADFLELDPKEHVFKRVGEDIWWQMKAKTRQGKYLHRVTAVWSSSDPKIVTVDEKGRVKAVAPGRATVIAKVGELTAEAIVEVQGVGKVEVEPAEGFNFEARGEPKPFTIKVFDLHGRPISDRAPVARCMNEDVCRTATDGVHPVDPGETTLLVTCEGQKAEVPVKVAPAKEEAAPAKGGAKRR
jgi:hypothetical protein